ncbi:phage tail protein [Enterobacter cloacae complex sp. 379K3]|uniref:phage tail fiber protein n=1 Tax=Enterobacter cloacae complex sp. 379K3 TaxID=3395865 RepID=UPI003CECADDE
MLYNTGTIAINGNTATGTGTNWTAPASQIRVGQTLFVLSNPVQMFQITAINSATSLTVTPAASPALSGQKYGILVTDSLSVDGLAQSMSQLINEYDENIGAWETFATTSANQNITVTINGTRVTIPAIGKLAQKGSNGAIPIGQGGTGATNVADARTNLGLGTSALLNARSNETYPADGVLTVGQFGIGADWLPLTTDFKTIEKGGIYAGGGATGVNFFNPYAPVLVMCRYATSAMQALQADNTTLAFNVKDANGWRGWVKLYSEYNTTRASDGTLKAASPVVAIFSDGSYRTNDESEGCTVTRLVTGQYLVEGCQGLNSDAAWAALMEVLTSLPIATSNRLSGWIMRLTPMVRYW